MFYIVVVIFRVVIFLYSEQSFDNFLNDYITLRAREKPQNYITLRYFAFAFALKCAIRRPKWND